MACSLGASTLKTLTEKKKVNIYICINGLYTWQELGKRLKVPIDPLLEKLISIKRKKKKT
jgi:hypothetical protein